MYCSFDFVGTKHGSFLHLCPKLLVSYSSDLNKWLYLAALAIETHIFQASQSIRKMYDSKCKVLGQLESKAESSDKIDKICADIKDLHSRIRVAIHRIDSISKKIEELRDKELQPQLEELIDAYVLFFALFFSRDHYYQALNRTNIVISSEF